MPNIIRFYIDDSGTRRPDHLPIQKSAHGHDWFAIGGLMIRDEEEATARQLHASFCEKWGITYPLHSVEIRHRNGNFLWLEKTDSETRNQFQTEIHQLMADVPGVILSCVVDRPGYLKRYLEKHGDERWRLCKTAFSVAVERAVKYATSQCCRLSVKPERCNRNDDIAVQGYYDDLRRVGSPFDGTRSAKYQPLSAADFDSAFYDKKIEFKFKSSPMVQMADLYLWPMAIGGYDRANRSYVFLRDSGKLIECTIPEDRWATLATKYSCFD